MIATASSLSDLHPLLGSAHIFVEIVKVKPPDKDARKNVRLDCILSSLANLWHRYFPRS
jgi:hypothetical protein